MKSKFRFLVADFSTKTMGKMLASQYRQRTSMKNQDISLIDLPFLLAQDLLLKEKKEIYTDARVNFDVNLKKIYGKANKLLNNNKLTLAATEFEKLIASLKNEKLDNLTSYQKEILTESCMKLSKIYRVGTIEEEEKALQLAHLACKVNPSSEEAINLVSSILAGRAPYPEGGVYDENMNEEPVVSKKI